MRMLLKNFTVLAVVLGLVLGVLLGFLLGNLPLGVILMVGIAIGGLALLDELEIDPASLASGRPARRVTPRSAGRPADGVTAPAVTPRGESPVRSRPVDARPSSPEPSSPAPSSPAPSSLESSSLGPEAGAGGAGKAAAAPTGAGTETLSGKASGTASGTPSGTITGARVGAAGTASEPASKPIGEPRTIVLVAGVGQQASETAKARDLYTNPLFRLSLDYAATLSADRIYILSAQHYLLEPDDEVAPEGSFLSTMKADELKAWSDEVLRRLRERADLERDRFVILAAHKYRKHLASELKHVELPTEGLSLSEQLDFLKAELERNR